MAWGLPRIHLPPTHSLHHPSTLQHTATDNAFQRCIVWMPWGYLKSLSFLSEFIWMEEFSKKWNLEKAMLHIPLTSEFMPCRNKSKFFSFPFSPVSISLDTGAQVLCFQAVTVSQTLVVSVFVLHTLQVLSQLHSAQVHYANEFGDICFKLSVASRCLGMCVSLI